MTYGEPGEIFRSINDDGQDNYMWGCADIAGECLELLKTYMELARNKHLS
jgi:hypothetical protein